MAERKGAGRRGKNKRPSGEGGDSSEKDAQGTPDNTQKPTGGSLQGGKSSRFPIVALGASAGGLGALSEFLSVVPQDSGMAFVVIQHLAPDRASSMPELLAHQTALEITVVEDGQTLQPNHVYVMPPGHFMYVKDSRLRLTAMPEDHRLPVDYFLRSLAEDQGEYGVAVILSGTGTDGTLGVRAVKGADGAVAVQDPETAEYPGMPGSAISTDQVDFVLPAGEIPEALVAYGRHIFGLPGEPAPEHTHHRPPALTEIFALLRERTGHDFSGYKMNTVLRRVARRMSVYATDDHWTYLRLLREHPDELDHLFKELIIPVTSFFRDADAFAALSSTVIPKLLENRNAEGPMRVWVPGCSTGEEAYSIAILLAEAMDAFKRHIPVQIFATDIDGRALDKARKGRYPGSIAFDIDEARLRRFFERDGDYYEVTKPIREMVVFAEQDIIKDPPFSRVDLISCRNLLIYLGVDLQRRLLPVFHYALREGGYLFLGAAETVGSMDDLFAVVDSRWKIFARRDEAVARHNYHALPQFSRRAPGTHPTPEQPRTADYAELVRHVLLRDHIPAAVLIDGHNNLLYLHGSTGIFLEPPAGHPTNDLLRMARPGLEPLMRGAIHRVRGRKDESAGGVAHVQVAGRTEQVRITAYAIDEADTPPNSVLVLMENLGVRAAQPPAQASAGNEEPDQRAAELEQQLAQTREELQATIEELETSNEELQSSNEELQSSNEELQSSNEELETSREELQSLNDELRSVNAELEDKVAEATRAKEDMNVLVASTEIGILFVDNRLRIEHFTPAVTSIIPILESDIGRPIEDLSHKLQYTKLQEDLEEVVESLSPKQHKVRGQDDHTYMIRMRPYRSAAGRVVGAVMVFIDVTEEAELTFLGKLRDALGQSEDMVMLMHLNGGVEYVNEVFCEATGHQPEEVVGKMLDALAAPGLADEDRRQMDWDLRHGHTWRGHFQYRCRDGSLLATEAFFAPIRTADSEVTHAVAYMQPIKHPD